MEHPNSFRELANCYDAEHFLLIMDMHEKTAEFAETARPYCKQIHCENEYLERFGFSHRVRHEVRRVLEIAKDTGYAPVKEIIRPFQSMGLGEDGCFNDRTTGAADS